MNSPLEKHYRLKEVSEVLGITVPNLRLMIDAGTIQAIKTPGGHRRIPERELFRLLGQPVAELRTCAIYARVSSHKHKTASNLERQVERLRGFADGLNLQITTVITDVGSGINENRKGLQRLLKLARERRIRVVLIEFRDRLTRFGYRYVCDYLALCGVEVLVKDESFPRAQYKDSTQELVDDLNSIISSYSGKLYGRYSAKFRKLKQCVQQSLVEEEG